MSDYGILVEDYYPAKVTNRIAHNIQEIIDRRNELFRELNRLTGDGVVWGNIVEEYRKVKGKEYGPYYRLTYYTDEHGHKPKPDYIPAKDVDKYKRWINNHATATKLQHQIDQLEGDLRQAKRHIEQLDRFLTGALRQYKQLVLPGAAPAPDGNTK